mmetsp:Transcript_7068/g.26476  ORF Transcript_7068/g.26476 Transcript_7068/m.26476 type:complete len:114 (+) Transcript_7068:3572-3913(+)
MTQDGGQLWNSCIAPHRTVYLFRIDAHLGPKSQIHGRNPLLGVEKALRASTEDSLDSTISETSSSLREDKRNFHSFITRSGEDSRSWIHSNCPKLLRHSDYRAVFYPGRRILS